MNPEDILGILIWILCTWGCAALFLIIGKWSMKCKDPMHFWSGSTIDPATVTDIPAYNRENGKMWMYYSIPYWVSGFFGFFFFLSDWFAYAGVAVIMLACFPGIYFLIRKYRKIASTYIRE